MNSIFRNFWNTLRRYKAASILNILGLSVAFAAFAIIMMQVRYDLTYDRFHTNYENIYRLETKWLNDDGTEQEGIWNLYSGGVSLPLFRVVESLSPDIVGSARFRSEGGRRDFKTDPTAEASFREGVKAISPGTFGVFDFELVAGDTTRFHLPGTALISRSQAEKMFPDTDPIGKTLYQGDQAREVIGVYADFPVNSLLKNVIYYPAAPGSMDDHIGSINGDTYVLLSSPEKKDEVEKIIQDELSRRFAGRAIPSLYRLTSLRDIHYRTDYMSDEAEKIDSPRTSLFLLIAVLIIGIAAINFVNFSISLVPARLRGINIQKVLGRTNAAIRGGMIFEAVGLCAISVLLSVWLVAVLRDTGVASLLPVDMRWSANYPVMAAVVVLALATGVIAGLYPAFRITSFAPALVLKGSYGLSPRGKKLRTLLISFQYTVSLSLIIAATFIHVQHRYMLNHSMGLERENVLTFTLRQNPGMKNATVREALERNPGILKVGFSDGILFQSNSSNTGGEYLGKGDISTAYKRVSSGLLEVFGIPLLEGRDFIESDAEKEDGAYLFNRAAQRKYDLQAGEILTEYYPADEEWPEYRMDHEVVGIFGDFNYEPLSRTIEPLRLHLPNRDDAPLRVVYLKVNGDIPAAIAAIRQTMRRLDPGAPDVEVRFFDETIGQFYEKESKLATLISLFSALAVLISIIGVFGLVLFETQYRRKEIGIRKVHGATIGEILRLLNQNFVRIVIVCFVIAAPVAWYAVKRWLEGFAYKSPVHWWIFAVALLAVGAITVLTVTLQSYRAATENPVNSLKTE